MNVAANDSVLSDVVEAIVAALYLDGGLDPVRRFVLANWTLDAEAPAKGEKDAKSRLQEFAMQKGLPLPAYRMVSRTGPIMRRRWCSPSALRDMGRSVPRRGRANRQSRWRQHS